MNPYSSPFRWPKTCCGFWASAVMLRSIRDRIRSRSALKEGLADADGVLATPLVPFPREVLDAGTRLRAIANIGVGYDNVDLDHTMARAVLVANTPGVLSDAVADCTMGMIIAIAHRFDNSARLVRAGRGGWPVPDPTRC